MVFGGFFTLKEAFENLRKRRFEIDTLMLVAAIGAATLGQWAEGALLLFLFSIGHALEHYAMGRARRAIEALAKLAPERATVRRGEGTEEIAVADLAVGDIVVIKPNERIAADGVVVAGESSVNQAPVTGESVPVDKRPAAADADFAKAERRAPGVRRHDQRLRRPGRESRQAGVGIDLGARRQDGRRGRGAALADAAVHRPLRTDLRARASWSSWAC